MSSPLVRLTTEPGATASHADGWECLSCGAWNERATDACASCGRRRRDLSIETALQPRRMAGAARRASPPSPTMWDRATKALFGWTWQSIPDRRVRLAVLCLAGDLVLAVALIPIVLLAESEAAWPPGFIAWLSGFFLLLVAYILAMGYAYWVSLRPSRAKRVIARMTLRPDDLPSGWATAAEARVSNLGARAGSEFVGAMGKTARMTIAFNLLLSAVTKTGWSWALVPGEPAPFAITVQELVAAGRVFGVRTLLSRTPPAAEEDTGPSRILSDATVYRRADRADRAFAALADDTGSAGRGLVGEESFAAAVEGSDASMLAWRRGPVVALLAIPGSLDTGLDDLVRLARAQDALIVSALADL